MKSETWWLEKWSHVAIDHMYYSRKVIEHKTLTNNFSPTEKLGAKIEWLLQNVCIRTSVSKSAKWEMSVKMLPVNVYEQAAVETWPYVAEANQAFPLSKEEF